jgi:hypothetical protein
MDNMKKIYLILLSLIISPLLFTTKQTNVILNTMKNVAKQKIALANIIIAYKDGSIIKKTLACEKGKTAHITLKNLNIDKEEIDDLDKITINNLLDPNDPEYEEYINQVSELLLPLLASIEITINPTQNAHA